MAVDWTPEQESNYQRYMSVVNDSLAKLLNIIGVTPTPTGTTGLITSPNQARKTPKEPEPIARGRPITRPNAIARSEPIEKPDRITRTPPTQFDALMEEVIKSKQSSISRPDPTAQVSDQVPIPRPSIASIVSGKVPIPKPHARSRLDPLVPIPAPETAVEAPVQDAMAALRARNIGGRKRKPFEFTRPEKFEHEFPAEFFGTPTPATVIEPQAISALIEQETGNAFENRRQAAKDRLDKVSGNVPRPKADESQQRTTVARVIAGSGSIKSFHTNNLGFGSPVPVRGETGVLKRLNEYGQNGANFIAIQAPAANSPIFSPVEGTIADFSNIGANDGHMVIIQHKNNPVYFTIMTNLRSQKKLKIGDTITKGQRIGHLGGSSLQPNDLVKVMVRETLASGQSRWLNPDGILGLSHSFSSPGKKRRKEK